MRIVLEVQGYARGRQLLGKKVTRVRVGDNTWRDAKDSNFENALSWLMNQGFKFEGKSTMPTYGTVTVRYQYAK